MEDLKKRVDDFNSLRLPGQPFGMHMGTSYLVNDLWEDIQKRDNELRKLVDDMRATIHSESCGCNGCEMLREYAGKFEKQLLDGGE